MCGIAGYLGVEPLDLGRVQAAARLMQRRGPDHFDYQQWRHASGRHCCLLHSRLSIIDLDQRSNQPLEAGHQAIVFNGELYNYRELRQQLLQDGHQLTTQSDTEVFLAAIHRYGWSVLDRCEGMWSLAVYDRKGGRLTLSRDRFGEKPLYYLQQGDAFFFGSEIKLLSALAGRPLAVNHQQIYRFLVNGYKSLYKHEGATFYEGVRELNAASVLHLHPDGTRAQARYWVPQCQVDDAMSVAEAIDGTRQRLIRAVELRLRADVPIAFCMSGGVDSNSLISIAKNVFDYDVHGFTIVNSDSRYEEQDVVEQAVAELGIRHTNIPTETHEFLPRLRTLVAYHDAPVYTITYFAHWLLMAAVAEHGYRISVSGTAADELFTGYFDHHLLYLAEVRHQPQLYEQARATWLETIRPIVRNPHLQNPDLFVERPDFREHTYLHADRFADRLICGWREPFSEVTYCDLLLRNRMLNELLHEATPVILHEDDLNAMYFSIENRSPFLDRELFEFCYRIPTPHLIRGGMAKAVLRDAMRGIVPDAVLDNPRKVGFNAPIYSFLDVRNPEVRESLLDTSPIFEHVRRPAIEQLIDQPQLPNSESKFLFSFLTCKMFLEQAAAPQREMAGELPLRAARSEERAA